MPTYDYQCDACQHSFEYFQSINAEPLVKCPECGKRKLRRLFGTGAAIVFKGSGFYQTDYRSESYKKGAEAAKKATEPEKGDGAKSESGESKSGESKSGESKSGESKSGDSGQSAKDSGDSGSTKSADQGS